MSFYGSVTRHELRVELRKDRRTGARYCRDCLPVRRPASHVGTAGGVAMMSGCEFHAYAWKRRHLLWRKRRG